jgi:hypothetical protein
MKQIQSPSITDYAGFCADHSETAVAEVITIHEQQCSVPHMHVVDSIHSQHTCTFSSLNAHSPLLQDLLVMPILATSVWVGCCCLHRFLLEGCRIHDVVREYKAQAPCMGIGDRIRAIVEAVNLADDSKRCAG